MLLTESELAEHLKDALFEHEVGELVDADVTPLPSDAAGFRVDLVTGSVFLVTVVQIKEGEE